MTATKLSRAVLANLAWIEVTGYHRPRVNVDTRLAVHGLVARGDFSAAYAAGLSGSYRVTDPGARRLVDGHPMVRKVRELEARGYRFERPEGRRRNQSKYVCLVHPDSTLPWRDRERIVWANGFEC